jgi:MoxR-like ATPase
MPRLLTAGWALEQATLSPSDVSADDLRQLARRLWEVDLTAVRELYADVVFKVRDLGVAFSDRRAVKAMKLVAASALLCGRTAAAPADLWVLRYVWDRLEQIAPLRTLVQDVLEQHPCAGPIHPRATAPEVVDAEEIARQLDAVEREWSAEQAARPGGVSPRVLARLRDRVADLGDRAAWVRDEAARRHLLGRSGELLKRLE